MSTCLLAGCTSGRRRLPDHADRLRGHGGQCGQSRRHRGGGGHRDVSGTAPHHHRDPPVGAGRHTRRRGRHRGQQGRRHDLGDRCGIRAGRQSFDRGPRAGRRRRHPQRRHGPGGQLRWQHGDASGPPVAPAWAADCRRAPAGGRGGLPQGHPCPRVQLWGRNDSPISLPGLVAGPPVAAGQRADRRVHHVRWRDCPGRRLPNQRGDPIESFGLAPGPAIAVGGNPTGIAGPPSSVRLRERRGQRDADRSDDPSSRFGNQRRDHCRGGGLAPGGATAWVGGGDGRWSTSTCPMAR